MTTSRNNKGSPMVVNNTTDDEHDTKYSNFGQMLAASGLIPSNNTDNNILNTTNNNNNDNPNVITTVIATSTNPNNNNSNSNNNNESFNNLPLSPKNNSQQQPRLNINNMSFHFSNNPHAMNDPTIQDILTPFFQPFGVDPSHLPITSPPIFQSSLTRLNEPSNRRRISISNGQIGQLNDDVETVENLYNTQPPPMPIRYEHPQPQPQPPPLPQLNNFNNNNNTNNNNIINNNYQIKSKGVLSNTSASTVSLDPLSTSSNQQTSISNISQQFHNNAKQQQQTALVTLETPTDTPHSNSFQNQQSYFSSSSVSSDSNNALTTTNNSSLANSQISVIDNHSNYNYGSNNNNNMNMSNNNLNGNPMPGTTAWKRARLLERNRIAASKCRQRKKVAQLQLQNDYDDLLGENKILQKKLNYYEKLVTKFKKFNKNHMLHCESAKSSSDSLKMVEEMLMIDAGVQEVDEQGLVVSIKDK